MSWTQVLASAGAAVTAAFIASLFGVTGTIVGTAVVSVVATTGSAIYNASLRRTNARLRQARDRLLAQQARQRRRMGSPAVAGRTRPMWTNPPQSIGAHPADLDQTDADPTSHSRHLSPPHSGPPGRRPAWKRRTPLVVGIAAAFVVTVVALTMIELIGQRPISALTGGTGSAQGTTFFGEHSSPSPAPGSTTTTTVARFATTVPVSSPSRPPETTATTSPARTTALTTPTTVRSSPTSTSPLTSGPIPP